VTDPSNQERTVSLRAKALITGGKRGKESERREELRRVYGGRLDFTKLLDTSQGTGVSNRWIVRSGRLHRFSLAKG
jgi:hypothetical protein